MSVFFIVFLISDTPQLRSSQDGFPGSSGDATTRPLHYMALQLRSKYQNFLVKLFYYNPPILLYFLSQYHSC